MSSAKLVHILQQQLFQFEVNRAGSFRGNDNKKMKPTPDATA